MILSIISICGFVGMVIIFVWLIQHNLYILAVLLLPVFYIAIAKLWRYLEENNKFYRR